LTTENVTQPSTAQLSRPIRSSNNARI